MHTTNIGTESKRKDVKAGAVVMSMLAGLLVLSSPASAGSNFANVKATAECTLGSAGGEATLTVDAGIIVTKTNENALPHVGSVTVELEQHTPGSPGWTMVEDSDQSQDVNAVFTGGIEGETASVATFDFPDTDPLVLGICDLIDSASNAVRAVVTVEVTNANANKRGGQGTSHVARCVSFANPC